MAQLPDRPQPVDQPPHPLRDLLFLQCAVRDTEVAPLVIPKSGPGMTTTLCSRTRLMRKRPSRLRRLLGSTAVWQDCGDGNRLCVGGWRRSGMGGPTILSCFRTIRSMTKFSPKRRVPRVPRISESWPHWKRWRSERRRRWTGGGSDLPPPAATRIMRGPRVSGRVVAQDQKLTLTERTIEVKALIDSKMLVEIEADAVVNASTA